MTFQDDELTLLYRSLDDKLGAMFSSRLARKSNGDWDEYDEEDVEEMVESVKKV